MFGPAVPDLQTPMRDCSRNNKCTSFNAIGNNRVFTTTQGFNAFDFDNWRSCALNPSAHLIEQFSQINDFRFTSSRVKYVRSFGQRCGHHQVFGACDSYFFEANLRTQQTALGRGSSDHVSSFKSHLGSKFFKTREVQIDWSASNGTATGKRDLCLPKTCK